MTDNDNINDMMFSQLVISLQMGAMQQMGKIASPVTGKIERDLNMAKVSIDMLNMMEAKTTGNLSEDEKKFLNHVLYELRINYVDESNKGDDIAKETETESKAADLEDKKDDENKAEK